MKIKKFTLLEITIGIAISSVIMVVIYALFSMWGKESNKQFKRLEYGKEYRNNLPRIITDIRYARKIVELKENVISLKIPTDINSITHQDLKTVTYEVKKKSSDQYQIIRYDGSSEKVLFEFSELKENVFTGYVEDVEKQFFSKYDPFKNGSKKRKNIVMIKILFDGKTGVKGKKDKISVNFTTRVCLDYHLRKLRESYWNSRK